MEACEAKRADRAEVEVDSLGRVEGEDGVADTATAGAAVLFLENDR